MKYFTASKLSPVLIGCFLSSVVVASTPDCTSKEGWPSSMTFVHLKNAGLIGNNSVDLDKTKVLRLASEKNGKGTYRQVHLVQYFKKSGEAISSIVVNDASAEECSMSGVDVYVVDKQLGDYSAKK